MADIIEGLFWNIDPSQSRKAAAYMPDIPETGWRPPIELPNIQHAPWIGIDCETFDPDLLTHGPGWARNKGHIVGISVAVPGNKWYFPIRHEVQPELNMDPQMVLRWAKWAFSGKGVKVGANLLYDIGWLAQEGVPVPGQLYDCQYAEALLNETSRVNLEALGQKYLGRGKESAVIKQWAKQAYGQADAFWRKDIYRCPVTLAGPYAEEDAQLPYEILQKQWPELVKYDLVELFHMECDLINVLCAMRFAGIRVDVNYAAQLREDFTKRSAAIMNEAQKLVGFPINFGSGESMAKAFRHLGLEYPMTEPSEKHPQGQPSFKKAFLEEVDHPFAKMIVQGRGLDKLVSTFIDSYILNGHVNGKVHTTFHPLSGEDGGTKTGRLSSSDPNLQNISVRSSDGKLIRACFIPDEGHLQLRDHDYSQIEYRMLAHYATGAGSDAVRAAYNADPDLDYHKLIGGMVLAQTGRELPRGIIKNINFGLVYGSGVAKLSEQMKVALKEGREFVKAFHESVPFAKPTLESIAAETGQTGIVTTILGRRSHFDDWEPEERSKAKVIPLPYAEALAKWGPAIKRSGLYKAVNYRLQGSAAELMKKGLVRCYKDGIFAETSIPRLTVHDELLFSEPHGVRPEAWKAMQNVFETCVPQVKVPIRFDGSVGKNWLEAH